MNLFFTLIYSSAGISIAYNIIFPKKIKEEEKGESI